MFYKGCLIGGEFGNFTFTCKEELQFDKDGESCNSFNIVNGSIKKQVCCYGTNDIFNRKTTVSQDVTLMVLFFKKVLAIVNSRINRF